MDAKQNETPKDNGTPKELKQTVTWSDAVERQGQNAPSDSLMTFDFGEGQQRSKPHKVQQSQKRAKPESKEGAQDSEQPIEADEVDPPTQKRFRHKREPKDNAEQRTEVQAPQTPQQDEVAREESPEPDFSKQRAMMKMRLKEQRSKRKELQESDKLEQATTHEEQQMTPRPRDTVPDSPSLQPTDDSKTLEAKQKAETDQCDQAKQAPTDKSQVTPEGRLPEQKEAVAKEDAKKSTRKSFLTLKHMPKQEGVESAQKVTFEQIVVKAAQTEMTSKGSTDQDQLVLNDQVNLLTENDDNALDADEGKGLGKIILRRLSESAEHSANQQQEDMQLTKTSVEQPGGQAAQKYDANAQDSELTVVKCTQDAMQEAKTEDIAKGEKKPADESKDTEKGEVSEIATPMEGNERLVTALNQSNQKELPSRLQRDAPAQIASSNARPLQEPNEAKLPANSIQQALDISQPLGKEATPLQPKAINDVVQQDSPKEQPVDNKSGVDGLSRKTSNKAQPTESQELQKTQGDNSKPKSFTEDEKPLKGSTTGGYNFEDAPDTYVPSKKQAKRRPSIKKVEDNQEGQAQSAEDRQLPKPSIDNEKPLKGSSSGGYNLEDAPDTYVPSKKATRGIPASKKVEQANAEASKEVVATPEIKETQAEEPKPRRPALSKAKPSDKQKPKEDIIKFPEDSKPKTDQKAIKPPSSPSPQPSDLKPVEDPKQANEQQPNADQAIKQGSRSFDDQPIGKGPKLSIPDEQQPGNEEGDAEAEKTLEGRIRSSKFSVRMAAFEELCQWKDPDYTAEVFAKSLHLLVKEKHPQVIDKLLTAMESLIESQRPAFGAVDFKKFIANFAEQLLCNVKGASKDHATAFVVKLWDASGKDEFVEQLKSLVGSIKMKVQEKALFMILEFLKAGKIEEMKYLKALWPDLEKQITSRTAAVKSLAMDIYKEAFLWMGEALKAFLGGLKKPQMDELEAYFKSIDPSKMKAIQKPGGKGAKSKPMDAYDIVQEQELPKKFNEDSWVEEVLAQAKWNEKKAKIDELNEILAKTPKLSPKTNAGNFLTLAKRIFMESNVSVQISVIKLLGLLASGLRKNFGLQAKTLFSTLLAKLKEKHKPLIDEILNTLEKFYIVLTYDETYDDLKEQLNEKSVDKKINLLRLLMAMNDKLDKLKTEQAAKKTVQLVLKLVDENDPGIRDLAVELIARQLDAFEDKKMQKINKLRQKQPSAESEEPKGAEKDGKEKRDQGGANSSKVEAGGDDEGEKGKPSKRNITKDKSQMIADIRENIFSNKTVKLSDTKNFSNYLFRNLTQLSEMTKEFRELTSSQNKEIYVLIDEICQKVDKSAFPEDCRKLIAQFYIEQALVKASDDLFNSIESYINCPSKLVNGKVFLQDAFTVAVKREVKLSRDLLVLLLKYYDREIQDTQKLSLLPHKAFVEFLKANFGQTINQTYKTPLLNTMRSLVKRFTDKSIVDFPQGLVKEFETQNAEAQKIFAKTFEKLSDKNPEKKKQVLTDIANYEDSSKILVFWSNQDFLLFLKRQLMMETKETHYASLVSILTHYLELSQSAPCDFNIKTFVYVFHAVLMQYYDKKEDARNAGVENFIQRAVSMLTPTKIIEELIADTNAVQWREQILHFFFQFANQITPSLKFMGYIIQLMGNRAALSDVKGLVEQVLLVIKGTHNDEVILKGNENKLIREIWLKNEEDLLIDRRIIKGDNLFEESTTFHILKQFITTNLKIEEQSFYNKNLEQVNLADVESSFKIKLAYFYIRSVENLPKVAEFIVGQFLQVDLAALDQISLLLTLKILFNILKNMLYQSKEEIFLQANNFFQQVLSQLDLSPNEIKELFGLRESETQFFEILVSGGDSSIQPEPSSYILDPADRSEAQQPRQDSGRPYNFEKKNMPQQVNPNENSRQGSFNRGEYESQRKKQARIGEGFSQIEAQDQAQDVAPEQPGPELFTGSVEQMATEDALLAIFQKMKTYDIVDFEEANKYFKLLCTSKAKAVQGFLLQYSRAIIETFVGVSSVIFQDGINYDLGRSQYELIFVPLQQLCSLDQFLCTLPQETHDALTEHTLTRLVLSNEEKQNLEASPKKEPEKIDLSGFMVKFWNSIMLKVIEFSETNMLLIALFGTILKFPEKPQTKANEAIFVLAFKCLIRITRNIKKNIENIDPRVVFQLLFRYIQTFGVKNSEAFGTKAVKTLLNELVSKSDPEYIWTCYDEAFQQQEDQHIKGWIQIIQGKGVDQASRAQPFNSEGDLLELIQAMNKQTKQSGVMALMPDLVGILNSDPQLNFLNYQDQFTNKKTLQIVINELSRLGGSVAQQPSPMPNGSSLANQGQEGQRGRSGQLSNKKQSMANKRKNLDQYLNTSDFSEQSDMQGKQDYMNKYS